MDFIKLLNVKKRGRPKGIVKGYVTIKDNQLHFVIHGSNKRIVEVGYIEGGLGLVTVSIEGNNKYNYCQADRRFEEGDIPANLQASSYKFKIFADKVSENEYVFMFKNAFMV